MHWAAQYIGVPWKFGAQGPDAFDCYAFTRHVQREHYDVEMLDVLYDRENWREGAEQLRDGEERDRWEQVTTPLEGDVVLMARNRLPIHIGTWIRANGTFGVLHCLEGSGVVFQPLGQLKMSGWGGLTYYRRKK